MKVAVVSTPLPPASSGQAMMLYRLLKDVSPEQYCLISPMNVGADGENYSRRLPGQYFRLLTTSELRRGTRFGLGVLREAFNVSIGSFMRGRQIARIVRRERCEAVMACSSGLDLLDVPSGFIASRLARVPFYLYLFDTYSHMWAQAAARRLGGHVEARVLRGAHRIVVTNGFVRELLRAQYAVESLVIHNPCDLEQYAALSGEAPTERDGETRIVYTGSVSESHYDAFRNLVVAIERLGRPDVGLHLYTTASAAALAAKGIRGPVVCHEYEKVFAMPGIQCQADVLFLPLAFKSPYPELLKVSSPGKVGEFLASRRPILVHAPRDSFLATYFRQHQCGLVVDRDDPQVLAEAIERLLGDQELRGRLGAHAWERAVADFSLEVARMKFMELLKLQGSRVPGGSLC
jgi:glycosyltransferase involved in cell wall biosynthesis